MHKTGSLIPKPFESKINVGSPNNPAKLFPTVFYSFITFLIIIFPLISVALTKYTPLFRLEILILLVFEIEILFCPSELNIINSFITLSDWNIKYLFAGFGYIEKSSIML